MARQVTKDIVRAFLNGENRKISNSEVHADCTGVYMYLFGNLIARRVGERTQVTLAGWNSQTTRERLNGLPNCKVYTRNGQAFINDQAVKSDEWVQI